MQEGKEGYTDRDQEVSGQAPNQIPPPPFPCLLLSGAFGETCLGKLPFVVVDLLGSLAQPTFGLGEGGAPQQGAWVLLHLVPLGLGLVEPLAPEQEFPVLIEPAA